MYVADIKYAAGLRMSLLFARLPQNKTGSWGKLHFICLYVKFFLFFE